MTVPESSSSAASDVYKRQVYIKEEQKHDSTRKTFRTS